MARKDDDYNYNYEYDEFGNEIIPEETEAEATTIAKDSNGATLAEGDTVKLIKDLKLKGGGSTVLKRGTVVKNIRLTDNPEEVEGRIDKVLIVLKACFLQKM
jgi:protein PhnA